MVGSNCETVVCVWGWGGLNVFCQILQVWLWARRGFKASLTEISGKHLGSNFSQSSSFRGTVPQLGLFLCPLLLHHADLAWLRKGLSIRSQRARQLRMIFELPHRNRVILKCSWAKPEFMAVEILKKELKRNQSHGFTVLKWIQPWALFC